MKHTNPLKVTAIFAAAFATYYSQNVSAAPPSTLVYNATLPSIGGTGNPGTAWTLFTDEQYNVSFGLNFWYNYPNYPGNPASPANPNDGAGTYTFLPGLNPNSTTKSQWNFSFSVNSDANGLSGVNLAQSPYDFYLGVMAPGATSYTWINVESYGDSAYGNNLTGSGQGTVGTFANEGGLNNVLFNSENVSFSPISASTALIGQSGTWKFAGEIVGKGNLPTATPVDFFNAAVAIQPTPEPGTLALAGIGGLGLLVLGRKRH